MKTQSPDCRAYATIRQPLRHEPRRCSTGAAYKPPTGVFLACTSDVPITSLRLFEQKGCLPLYLLYVCCSLSSLHVLPRRSLASCGAGPGATDQMRFWSCSAATGGAPALNSISRADARSYGTPPRACLLSRQCATRRWHNNNCKCFLGALAPRCARNPTHAVPPYCIPTHMAT